jgi:hypothetical protein
MDSELGDPVEFFGALGGLHDSEVFGISWDALGATVTLAVSDLNANFDGRAEYEGKREASIIFSNVENVQLNCDARKGDTQRIYEIEIKKNDDRDVYALVMSISPSGHLSCDFGSVRIKEKSG